MGIVFVGELEPYTHSSDLESPIPYMVYTTPTSKLVAFGLIVILLMTVPPGLLHW